MHKDNATGSCKLLIRAKGNRGFSILELLIVVAIIGILLALYSGALSRALQMAKSTATSETMRQKSIARRATPKSEKRQLSGSEQIREQARAFFRQTVDTGKNDAIITELLYRVDNDNEFSAYFHTLLNRDNSTKVEFAKGGALRAVDARGRVFDLEPVGFDNSRSSGTFAIRWEYISTRMSERGTGSLGAQVQYNDGHVAHVGYPGAFPCTRIVAELGHEFMR